jgi:hypothetical protein
VWLWEKLAEHYKDNTWVAGYNPLNEPADRGTFLSIRRGGEVLNKFTEHTRLVGFYDRIEAAIRRVDPEHILFLDGNTYAMGMLYSLLVALQYTYVGLNRLSSLRPHTPKLCLRVA